MRSRWICKKCGYLQKKDWTMYHRCAQCGSIDIEPVYTEPQTEMAMKPI